MTYYFDRSAQERRVTSIYFLLGINIKEKRLIPGTTHSSLREQLTVALGEPAATKGQRAFWKAATPREMIVLTEMVYSIERVEYVPPWAK